MLTDIKSAVLAIREASDHVAMMQEAVTALDLVIHYLEDEESSLTNQGYPSNIGSVIFMLSCVQSRLECLIEETRVDISRVLEFLESLPSG
jgi:hypothetical protein